MSEDRVGNLQDALDFLHLTALQVELLDDVMALALFVDRIGKPPFSPRRHLLDLASVGLDQLADLVDLLLNCLIIKLRLDDIHELVRRHALPPFPWDLLRLWPDGAPTEQESGRKSTKQDRQKAAARRRPQRR